MIAIVGMLPPSGEPGGVEVLDCLPPPASTVHSGFLVHCLDAVELGDVLRWHGQVRDHRPTVALGLACRLDVCAASVAAAPYAIRPVISPDSLHQGRAPAEALTTLRSASIVGTLLEELSREHGTGILTQRDLLEDIIAYAIPGRTIKRLSRDRGCHPQTIRRHLHQVGLEPGYLMTAIRLRAHDLMVELGDDRDIALHACGWTDMKARDASRARLRRRYQRR